MYLPVSIYIGYFWLLSIQGHSKDTKVSFQEFVIRHYLKDRIPDIIVISPPVTTLNLTSYHEYISDISNNHVS